MDYPSQPDFNYFDSTVADGPEPTYHLNRELNLAHRIVEETGANLFLTGKAGTGKTTFLRRLRQTSPKRMVVLAPTGVAAINAEGSTIHSFFQLSFSPFIPGKGFIGEERKRYSFSKEKRRIIASLDLLVIDEISMVRPDTLDAIDDVMRHYRNPALPFGGAQLLLIGDLRQLAPVLRDNERQLLAPYYPSEYFFESHALKQSGFVTIELSNVYRQSDEEFISLLNDIRDGNFSTDILKRLNSRYLPGFMPADEEGYIRLTTHNQMADSINYRRLEELQGTGMVYQAVISGNFPESSYPAEFQLRLKIGARVMFIKNDSGNDRKYYNGMLGRVVNLSEDWVTVRPDDGSGDIAVNPVAWENTRYVINEESKEILQHTEGTFTQLPLRLAWAITIHKSQGLTFDRAIIDAGFSFAPGQTYVALSRCRSMEGLVLGQQIPSSAVITDRKVNDFIVGSKASAPDNNTLERMRAEYTRHVLADIFDFRAAKVAFDDFHRTMSEYVIPLYPDYYAPFKEAQEMMEHQIDRVGAKFSALYASTPVAPEELGKHPEFLERIRKGCAYFMPLLEKMVDIVKGVKVNLENSTYVSRLTNTHENALYQLNLKTGILRRLADTEFSPAAFIDAKAAAVIDSSSVQNRAVGGGVSKGKREKKPKRPVGYSKRTSLDMFMRGLSIAQIAEERNLATSTIAIHLAEFVASGEIGIDNIITRDKITLLESAFRGGASITDAKEKLQAEIEPYEVQLYYRGIVAPARAMQLAESNEN